MRKKSTSANDQTLAPLLSSYDKGRIFMKQPIMEDFIFSRLLWAFDSAKWTQEDKPQAEAFVVLCKLVRYYWRQDCAHLSEANFSLAIDKWTDSLAHGVEFESDIWRRKIAEFIVSFIYGQDREIHDFIRILVDKCRQLERLIYERDLETLAKSALITGRHYLGAIIKTLLEFENQSEMLHDFAAHMALSRDLYPTAMRILLLNSQLGGALSTPAISDALSQAGQRHENVNDDLKQLCDQGLFIKCGSRKKRLYVAAAFKEVIVHLPAKCKNHL